MAFLRDLNMNLKIHCNFGKCGSLMMVLKWTFFGFEFELVVCEGIRSEIVSGSESFVISDPLLYISKPFKVT